MNVGFFSVFRLGRFSWASGRAPVLSQTFLCTVVLFFEFLLIWLSRARQAYQ